MDENRGSPKSVIIGLLLILIGGFLGLDFLRARQGEESLISWSLLINHEAVSRRIDSAINEALVQMGISMKDLILEYSEEKKDGKLKWIHFTKQVRVPTSRPLKEYYRAIEKAVKKVGGRVISHRTLEEKKARSLMMVVGMKSIITCRLTLEQPKRVSSGN
ncbi:hypothetical protein KAU86_04715 [bacterium]|nr:hypothetical protein [bacterium]MCK4326145.1 hypothetical protein [bacterium]MCK4437231.1 hypothetical protein [bacterium]